MWALRPDYPKTARITWGLAPSSRIVRTIRGSATRCGPFVRTIRRPRGLLGVELDRRAVDAVAQPGRLRPVVEDVAQVPTAVRARDLGPDHEVRVVRRLLDGRALGRGIKARPPAVGVELGLGLEQLRPAARAQVGARRLGVPVLAGEGSLGSLLTQHVVLGRGQISLPLGCALLDFALLHRL